MRSWTILTPEFPPSCGGVGDYAAQVAGALASAGDEVTVFTPPQSGGPSSVAGVDVVVLADTYGPASRGEIDRRLADRGTTMIVQYVPTAFGLKGANVPWCRWLLDRSQRAGADVRVMFHEPYFDYGWKPLHQGPLSIVQRAMARLLLRAGETTYLSTDAWRSRLSRYARERERRLFVTLPIPSTIPRAIDAGAIRRERHAITGRQDAAQGPLIGHFGTYGTHVAPLLRPALIALLRENPDARALCAGAGSDAFANDIVGSHPDLLGRVHGTGRTSAERAANILAACDLMLQPFPDGVTTRRTSVMAALHNGRPVLTTTGELTEAVWQETGAVALTQAEDGTAFVDAARRLLEDAGGRSALAARGERAYADRFALAHTIAALREPDVAEVARVSACRRTEY
jgi:glycosyltransferase involved in cell wall biosynthesis